MKLNFRYIRYGLFIISFVILIFAIKVFLQNFNMNKNIQQLKDTQLNLSWDTLWLKKYYNPFLKSDYAKLLILHTSWLPAKNEILIRINKINNLPKLDTNIIKQDKKIIPWSSEDFWYNFFWIFKKIF